MAHIRQQIREAVNTNITGLTTTGSNVFDTRFYPLEQSNLPALLLYSGDSELEYTTMGDDRTVVVRHEVIIEAIVEATSAPEDTLDTIIKEVQIANAQTNLGGLAQDFRLESIETSMDAEGEQPIVSATLTYACEYHYRESDPETAL